MDDAVEEIKARLLIEDLIEEMGFPLQHKHGRYIKGREHDSLVVDTHNQAYYWNSQSESGDIFNWVQNRNKDWDFKQALEFLARKANVRLEERGGKDLPARLAVRAREDAFQVAQRVFAKWLKGDPEALAYVRGRGWNDETIEKSGIGFSGRATATDLKEMAAEFALYGVDPLSPAAVAVTGFKGDIMGWCKAHGIDPKECGDWVEWKFIPGMMGRKRLVYAHIYQGRVRTLSGRNILGDEINKEGHEVKSYNIPVVLGGSRQAYFNRVYGARAEELVLVEGQGDAVTLGQWGMDAMATAGTAWSDYLELFRELRKRHETIYLATDADEAGRKVVRGRDGEYPLAEVLGPMLRVVAWPEKDANAWLQAMVTAGTVHEEQLEETRAALDGARPIVLLMAEEAGGLKGAKREALIKRTAAAISRMERTTLVDHRLQLSQALYPGSGQGLRQLNALLTAGEKDKKEDENGKPMDFVETVGGWFSQDGKTGWLLEYLYDGNTGKAALAYRDPNGNVGQAAFLDIGGIRYIPKPPNDLIKSGGIVFPSALGELKSTRELVAIVEMFISSYFIFDNKFDYRLTAYYVLLTWCFDCFGAIPYLRATGDYGSGKSELMMRIGFLCNRLMITTGAGSSSSLFHALHEYRGTALMDEMDLRKGGDMTDDIIKILNVGAMKRQALIWRSDEVKRADGTRGYETVANNVYGPKLIAMRGRFYDQATESRCLTFKLMGKEALELKKRGIPLQLNKDFFERAEKIRNLLLRWRLWFWQPEIELTEDLLDLTITARLNQVIMPLKAIAKDDTELRNDIERFTRALNRELVLERSMGLDARVMDAIIAILEEENYSSYLIEGEINGYGAVNYAYTKHITLVANRIMDEMNVGTDDGKEEDGEEQHKKRKTKETTVQTTGAICRHTFLLPTHRKGRGYVIIFVPERIEALRLKYGLETGRPRPEPMPASPTGPPEPDQLELLEEE